MHTENTERSTRFVWEKAGLIGCQRGGHIWASQQVGGKKSLKHDSLVVMIPACHAGGRGSIPCKANFFRGFF